MDISVKEIEHIADLSRITLTVDEKIFSEQKWILA